VELLDHMHLSMLWEQQLELVNFQVETITTLAAVEVVMEYQAQEA
jgi:hypothetical protein